MPGRSGNAGARREKRPRRERNPIGGGSGALLARESEKDRFSKARQARIDAGDLSEIGKYGSNEITMNGCFSTKAARDKLIGVNFQSFAPADVPQDWDNPKYSKTAANSANQVARLVGFLPLILEDVSPQTVAELQAAHFTMGCESILWDDDGAFPTPAGQIPIIRLSDHGYVGADIDALIALQSPISSPWKIPLIRVATNHHFVADSMKKEAAKNGLGTLHVHVYVWFTRLIFEMIADPAIKNLMECLHQPGIVPIRDVVQQKTCDKPMFRSTQSASHDNPSYRYSMAGLMKSAESAGYPMSDGQPDRLKVQLYDFQKSTYQWMLDQENAPGGINARFWQEWKYQPEHGGSMFYFPEAGELRLVRPPHSTGGLLCEEMGLGKTVEVIATILGNPRPKSSLFVTDKDGGIWNREVSVGDVENTNGMWQSLESTYSEDQSQMKEEDAAGGGEKEKNGNSKASSSSSSTSTSQKEKAANAKLLVCSRATLIVVPPVLMHQWQSEIQERVESSESEPFQILKYTSSGPVQTQIDIPLNKLKLLDADKDNPGSEWGLGLTAKVTELLTKCTKPEDVNARKREKQDLAEGVFAYIKSVLPDRRQQEASVLVRLPKNDPFGASKAKVKVYDELVVTAKAINWCIKDSQYRHREWKILRDATAVAVERVCDSIYEGKKQPVAVGDTVYLKYATKTFLESHMHDKDVVLTNYDTLNKDAALFRSVHWHRVVLDECQEIKSSTTKIASEVAKLYSNHRWMVSGTPLVSKIEDLHGELNFLRVWPFSLSETQDGFWGLKIGKPFREKNPGSLELLNCLIHATMMRHSKSQVYADTGAPLIRMTPRTIEWRGFSLQSAAEKYLYAWLECYVTNALDKMIEEVKRGNNGRTDNAAIRNAPLMQTVKSLFFMLSRLCTAVETLDLRKLDMARRKFTNLGNLFAPGGALDPNREGGDLVKKLEGAQILELVQMGGMGRLGDVAGAGLAGMNYNNNRVQANVELSDQRQKLHDMYDAMRVEELRKLVLDAGMPVPMTWMQSGLLASVIRGNKDVLLTQRLNPSQIIKETDGTDPATFLKSPVAHLGGDPGPELRICSPFAMVNGTPPDRYQCQAVMVEDKEASKAKCLQQADLYKDYPSDDEKEQEKEKPASSSSSSSSSSSTKPSTLIREFERGKMTLEEPWANNTQRSAVVSKFVPANNKAPYKELMIQKELAGKDGGKGNAVHGAGFETLFNLMGGEYPECVLCLEQMTRPTVTMCVHAFCHTCILAHLSSKAVDDTFLMADGTPVVAKCPVCRRDVRLADLMECVESGAAEEEEEAATILALDEDGARRKKRVVEEEDEEEEYGEKEAKADAGDDEEDNFLPDDAELVEADVEVEDLSVRSRGRKRKGGASSSSSSSSSSSGSRRSSSLAAGGGSGSRPSSRASVSVRAASPNASETQFIVPNLDLHSSAAIEQDYMDLPKLQPWQLLGRNAELLSLDQTVLTHFSDRRMSSRFKAILEDIAEVHRDDPFAKFVVFSQYIESLKAVERMFCIEDRQRKRDEQAGFTTVCINLSQTRSNTVLNVEDALIKFNTDPACNICLLTSGSSAAGLTLTAAKVCYILEPTHNAAEEAQALNRVHRIGQLQSVRCVIFYAKATCEERILALRHEQNTLTTMLSNLNNVMEAGEDKEEEEEKEEVVTANHRRAQSRKRNRRQVSTLSGNAFFSAGQLHLLFGATEERRERKESMANQEVIAASASNRARNPQAAVPPRPQPQPQPHAVPRPFNALPRPGSFLSQINRQFNRSEREAQGVARAPKPSQRYSFQDLIRMGEENSSDDEDWDGDEDIDYVPRQTQREKSRSSSAEVEIIEISD